MATLLLQPTDRAKLAAKKSKLAAISKDTSKETARKSRAAYAAFWLAKLHIHKNELAQVRLCCTYHPCLLFEIRLTSFSLLMHFQIRQECSLKLHAAHLSEMHLQSSTQLLVTL